MILHSLKLTARTLKNGWKPIGISEIPGVFSGAGRVPLVSGVKERTPGVKIGQLLCEAFWGSFEAKTKLQGQLYIWVYHMCIYIYIEYIYIYVYAQRPPRTYIFEHMFICNNSFPKQNYLSGSTNQFNHFICKNNQTYHHHLPAKHLCGKHAYLC